MDQQTIYLVTGAGRGVGKGIVSLLLQRPNTIVIASLRDITSTATKDLEALPTATNTKLITIKIDSLSETDALSAISTLKIAHSITHLDTVIAVSGIANAAGPAHIAPISTVSEHFRVNAIGTLLLYQAVYPPLLSSPLKDPKFVAVSSHAGSIGDMENEPFPFTAYGSSKAALNFMVRKMHFETEERGMVVFPIHPGWVATELGNRGAEMAGLESAPVSVVESAEGILKRIDGATREETGGTFQTFDGQIVPW